MRRVCSALMLFLLAGFIVADNKVSARFSLMCSLTGKKIAACCCEQKDGKLYCPLAKKAIEQCCCK